MNRKFRRRRGFVRAALLITLASWAASAADASPIRTRGQQLVQARELNRVDGYFRRALQLHALRVTIPKSLHGLSAVNGMLPDSAFVEYLRWRHGLNPLRFDAYHPRMGPMIELDQQIRAAQVLPPVHVPRLDSEKIQGPTPTTPTGPMSIPEPSTGLIGLALIGAAAWRRRRR